MCHSLRYHRATHSFPTRRSSDLGLGCSSGQCVCTANTPNGTRCYRPGQQPATCWGGTCVLPAFFSGCSTATDCVPGGCTGPDRKSTRLNSSHANISYAVFCLKKK